jgi:hypothetical protein
MSILSHVIVGFVPMQSSTQDPKSCVTMEDPITVTLVRTSLVLVMEEVHHKGDFLVTSRDQSSKYSSQAYRPLS